MVRELLVLKVLLLVVWFLVSVVFLVIVDDKYELKSDWVGYCFLVEFCYGFSSLLGLGLLWLLVVLYLLLYMFWWMLMG